MDNKTIKIEIKAPKNKIATSNDVFIKLSDGTNLGLCQSIKIEAQVGSTPKATITTICNEAELEFLQKNTELKVIVQDENIDQKLRESPEYKSMQNEILKEMKPGGILYKN